MDLVAAASTLAQEDVERVFRAWAENRSEATQRAYASALRDFGRHAGSGEDPTAAVLYLVGLEAPRAQLAVLEYLGSLRTRGVAPSTARNRLSALKSVLRAARMAGLITWQLELDAPRGASRVTAGPPVQVVRDAFAAIENAYEGAERARLRLVMRLLFDLSLRAAEPGTVDHPSDLALRRGPSGALFVLRKRRPHKEPWHLTPKARDALEDWFRFRGQKVGPLLHTFTRAKRALSARVVRMLVADLGETIGHHLTPNGLRHTANTIAMVKAQEAGFTIDEVMQFTSHRQPQTLLAYKDQLRETQTKIARLVSEAL